MAATNMCSNFGGKWYSPPLLLSMFHTLYQRTQLLEKNGQGCHIIWVTNEFHSNWKEMFMY